MIVQPCVNVTDPVTRGAEYLTATRIKMCDWLNIRLLHRCLVMQSVCALLCALLYVCVCVSGCVCKQVAGMVNCLWT